MPIFAQAQAKFTGIFLCSGHSFFPQYQMEKLINWRHSVYFLVLVMKDHKNGFISNHEFQNWRLFISYCCYIAVIFRRRFGAKILFTTNVWWRACNDIVTVENRTPKSQVEIRASFSLSKSFLTLQSGQTKWTLRAIVMTVCTPIWKWWGSEPISDWPRIELFSLTGDFLFD